MKKAKTRRLPRRHLKSNRLLSWCIFIQIAGRGNNGERNLVINKKILFCAPNGGVAKTKALPKLQSFLRGTHWDFLGSPKVIVFLIKDDRRGRDEGCPSYKSRGTKEYMGAILKEKRPSNFFIAF